MTEPRLRAWGTTMSRRTALAGMAALLASGCFGEFAATRALYDWNTEVSDNKWLRWLVFLVLAILPVYFLFIAADAIVLNTIEFFSGKNPVEGRQLSLPDGSTLKSSRTSDPNLIRHEHHKDGELARVLYVRRLNDREMLILDESRRVLSRVRIAEDGSARVLDEGGRPLRVLSRDGAERALRAIEAGAPLAQAVQAELDSAGSALASR